MPPADSVGDEADRGFMPGDKQSDGGRDRVETLQLAGLRILERREPGQDIVRRTLSLGVDKAAEIGAYSRNVGGDPLLGLVAEMQKIAAGGEAPSTRLETSFGPRAARREVGK